MDPLTLEKEKDGSLSFLDDLLSRDPDGSIRTSVFRKPTHTDKYLQFSSHHPLNHKMSVIKTLFNRASLLYTSLVEQSIEESHIVQGMHIPHVLYADLKLSVLVRNHMWTLKFHLIFKAFRNLSREFLVSWICSAFLSYADTSSPG